MSKTGYDLIREMDEAIADCILVPNDGIASGIRGGVYFIEEGTGELPDGLRDKRRTDGYTSLRVLQNKMRRLQPHGGTLKPHASDAAAMRKYRIDEYRQQVERDGEITEYIEPVENDLSDALEFIGAKVIRPLVESGQLTIER